MLNRKLLSTLTVLLLLFSQSIKAEVESKDTQPKKPKNIILMISDGSGFNGWLAADYFQGLAGKQTYQITRPDGTKPKVYGLAHSSLNLVDTEGNTLPSLTDPKQAAGPVAQGYDPQTRWQRFENSMMNDFQASGIYTSYTDSAAAGTALMSGNKTSNGRINIDWSGEDIFKTITQIAIDHGLSAGVVTSVQASHATPAAAVAHNTSRENYAEIFNEMAASQLSVIMGAGHPEFDNSGNQLAEKESMNFEYVGGESTYSVMKNQQALNDFTFIDDKSDFEALASGKNIPERVLGIARAGKTLQAERLELAKGNTPSGMAFNSDVPNLSTMALGALNVLSQDDDGFFVMIEGGAVDWMGHVNHMPRFIEEQIDFNAAVNTVIDWVETHSSWEETLLIVTSDHECGGIWGEGTWTNSQGGYVATERTATALIDAHYNPNEDVFNEFLAVQDRGEGNIPGYQFASPNHTNDLVPLWILGHSVKDLSSEIKTDAKARELWGEQYGWNGDFIENTVIFSIMKEAITHSNTSKD